MAIYKLHPQDDVDKQGKRDYLEKKYLKFVYSNYKQFSNI